MAENKAPPNNGIIYLFIYAFLWFSGIIALFTIAQNDRRAMFHALQAIGLGIFASILDLVLFAIPLLGPFLALMVWVYAVYIGYIAYRGKDIKAVIVGEFSEHHSGYTVKRVEK